MTRHTPRAYAVRLAVIGICVIALQGCAGGMATIFGPRAPEVQQIRVPEPAPTRPQSATNRATPQKIGTIRSAPRLTRSLADTTGREDIALRVTYLERILVPIGSRLVLQAQGGGDRPPALKSIKTEGGPPYTLALPVDTGEGAYPMTVQATLTSTIGHVLSGAVTLSERPAGPVEIVMRTSAARNDSTQGDPE